MPQTNRTDEPVFERAIDAMAYEIANATRIEARSKLEDLRKDANPPSIWGKYRSAYWHSLVGQIIKRVTNSRRVRLIEAEQILAKLMERAGEPSPLLGDFHVYQMCDLISRQGAIRVIAALCVEPPDSQGLSRLTTDSEIFASLVAIAQRKVTQSDPFESMRPSEAWDLLARRVGRPEAIGHFRDYYAGRSLYWAARERSDPGKTNESLICTAGLWPYSQPEWDWHHEMLLFPIRSNLGERFSLVKEGESEIDLVKSLVKRLVRLSGHASMQILHEYVPRARSNLTRGPERAFLEEMLVTFWREKNFTFRSRGMTPLQSVKLPR